MRADVKALLVLAAVVAVIFILSLMAFMKAAEDEQALAGSGGCPPDNMTCPDGKVVYRVLPDCSFQKCPTSPSDAYASSSS